MKNKMTTVVETRNWVYRGSLYFRVCRKFYNKKISLNAVLGKGEKNYPLQGFQIKTRFVG